MTPKLATTLQDLIVGDLNAATLSFANGKAKADLVPKRDLSQINAEARLLVVVGDRVRADGTRAADEQTQDIHVGFLQKLTSDQPPTSEFQPLIDFVDTELPEFFYGKRYTLPGGQSANWSGTAHEPLYVTSDVIEKVQFTSVLVTTWLAL